MTVQVPAGRRHQRFTLTMPGPLVPDGGGGWIETPITLADPVYGAIQPASVRDLERTMPNVVIASASHVVVIPYVPGVTLSASLTLHDALEGERVFTIAGIVDPDERHIQLELACEEVK